MKFVKLFFVFISTTFIVSCSSLEAPVYKGVGNVEVLEVLNDSIVIKADLNFNNPNRIGGKLFLNNLHTEVNNIDLGKLKDKEVNVPSKKDFLVPLEMKLSRGQIFNSKKGLLGALLGSVLKNELTVQLDGNATFKKLLFKKEYPIHFVKKIKLFK